MYRRSRGISRVALEEAFKQIIYLLILIVLVFLIYKLAVLPTPVETGKLPEQGAEPTILDKIGPRAAITVIVIMVGLLAWVFWLFIHFGRRLSERGYLGPLTSDALARAEISRIEDDLREDLRKGVYVTSINVRDDDFKRRYGIPLDTEPPTLVPGVTIDDSGNVLRRDFGWEYPEEARLGTGSGDEPINRDPTEEERKQIEQEKERRRRERDRREEERKIRERYREAYEEEQLRLYREELLRERNAARERARALVPDIDVSSFGGGWIFVLEFTTIIFIVFAALALGFVAVLSSEQIGTILASIAGYVLGKSATFRSPGGHEIVRGGEQPTALLDVLGKQAESRAQTEAEKVQIVPYLIGKTADKAESSLKEKGLSPVSKLMPNSEVEEGIVYDQAPIGGIEVQKGSTVVLFVAQKPPPPPPNTDLGGEPKPETEEEVEGEEGEDAQGNAA